MLLAALVALGLIAQPPRRSAAVRHLLDAGMALALIALWRFGPLRRLRRRPRPPRGRLARAPREVFRAGNLANVAAYGWKALAAAARARARAPAASAPTALPWLLLAAAAQISSTGPSARRIYGTAVARAPVARDGADARATRCPPPP